MKPAVRITIPTDAGPLAGLLHLPFVMPAPVVVCCHGMLSSKDSQKFVMIGETVCRAGAAVVRFDFTGCGQSETAMEESLLFSRLRDLHAVLDYVGSEPWSNGKTGLVGSSLGGYLSLLAASSDRHAIDAVVCWATPFDLGKIKRAVASSGDLGPLFPPGFTLGSPENLESLPAIGKALVIHGRLDEVVPWSDAIAIYQKMTEPKRLLLVEQADHRFLDPDCRRVALDATVQWLSEQNLCSHSE